MWYLLMALFVPLLAPDHVRLWVDPGATSVGVEMDVGAAGAVTSVFWVAYADDSPLS